MAELNSRFLLLAVAVTVLAGLLVGWIGGLATTGLVRVSETVGFVAGVLLLLGILIASWLVLADERANG